MNANEDAKDDIRPLVEFNAVSKWYGPVIAVNDVSLRLEAGTIGLIGPNGAGKTTLLKLLTGLLRPSLGDVRVRGLDAWKSTVKAHVGYCPDADAFYEEMNGRTFVRTMARWHGLRRIEAYERTEEVLERVGMDARADRPIGSYSKGMRQRIKLARAMVHDPDFLVLDEPLNGVDPMGRTELVSLFHSLAERGKTILISSHVLDEMDSLADRILFMCRGRLVVSGTLDEVRTMLDEHPLLIRISASRVRKLAARLLHIESVLGVELSDDESLLLQVRHPTEFFTSFGQIASSEDFNIQRLQVVDASTEAVFDYLLKRVFHS